MIISFYQVIGWAETFLNDMRKRGMAGNIIRDQTAQLEGDELALWTGLTHQLAFCGSDRDYRLELRKFLDDGSNRELVAVEKDTNNFNWMMIDFFAKEG